MPEPYEAKGIRNTARKANSFAAKAGFLFIGLVIGLLIGIGGILFIQSYNPKDEPEAPAVVNPSVIFERVVAQNEMVSASQRYNITEKSGNEIKIPLIEMGIPFTDNSYWYRCVGTLKYGVSLKTAGYKVSDDGKSITIILDPPYIIGNTPDMEQSGVLEERNNLLNPIHIEDVDNFRAECVALSEQKAVEGGVLNDAKENAEANIKGMFNAALGDEYNVSVEWRNAEEA